MTANGNNPNEARAFSKMCVVGGGAWGTALASTVAQAGVSTCIWARSDRVVADINERHENSIYLPDVPLPESLRASGDLEHALHGADAVMIVVPSTAIRSVTRQVARYIAPDVPVAICAKGVETQTGMLMAQVGHEELGDRPIGCVSGPTFARETALRHPTAAVVAFPFGYADRLQPHQSAAARFAVSLTTESFRAYVSDDLTGVEVGGAVKNVIAIACGMMTGAGFAENTRAALITRGLDEMKRLALALGGQAETISGLSGVGDLSLTCSTPTSRNMALGLQLGEGLARADCFKGQPVVVEGERNAKSVRHLAHRVGVEMPICETVHSILYEGADIGTAFAALWARPIEAEPSAMLFSLSHPASDEDIEGLARRIA